MRTMLLMVLAAAIAVAQQAPINANDRVVLTSITNASGAGSDIVIKTDTKKVSVQLMVFPSHNAGVTVYKTPHTTNTWVATNLVTELITNRTAVALNRVVTNVITNVVTHVWANVVSISNTRNYTNAVTERTNVTTYRYTVPFAFTITNITVAGVTNDAYLGAATTNTWTNATTATNIRTLTLRDNYWYPFTNTYINHFLNTALTNSQITNIVTIYRSNAIIGQKKYLSTVYVTNTITNTWISGYTNIITNTTVKMFSNMFVSGMVTLMDPARVAKTNTFRVFKDAVLTNVGTRVISNYAPASNHTKVQKVALDKNSLYLFRATGATNVIFNFVFSEIQ